MSCKRRSRHVDYAVYVAVRLVIVVLQLIPVHWALGFAWLGGWLAYHLNKRHRLVAADNLRHAFPEHAEVEIDRLVRATYRHVFTMAVETVLLMRTLRASNVVDFIGDADLADRDFCWQVFHSNRPVIVMTGHLGNWEALSLGVALQGGRGAVVARPLDNPFLDRFVRKFRASTGMRIVDKTGAADEVDQVLASGGSLGLVGDQDAGPKGLFVDFFGRPASSFKSIALLALKYQAPILVLGCVRTGAPLKHVTILEDAIMTADYQHDPAAVRLVTQRYTSALERLVRRHPEQYFWLHRRWKHEPPLKKKKMAA